MSGPSSPERSRSALLERGFMLLLPAVSALYIWLATKLPDPPGGNILIGPRTVPMLIGELMLLVSLILVWQAFRPGKPQQADLIAEATDEGDEVSIQDWHGALAVFGAMLFLALTLRSLGFVAAMTLMVFGLATFFAPRSWPLNLAVGVGFGVGSYLLFTQILQIPLPNGILRSVL